MQAKTLILGIESSCDDSSASIVSSDKQILANIVISQNNEHSIYKGVVPEIAARSHMQNLDQAVKMALKEARIELNELSAIAATCGPGLIGGVIVGSMLGKGLSSSLKIPFISINHLEGHALTARLVSDISYPYLLLLISGGHCQFVSVEALGKYKILGQTIDDAVGEAFDKVAKMMNLSFPGGPEIEQRAKLGNPATYVLPKPIINQANCDMSFSGLKTAVKLLIDKIGPLDDAKINNIAASFQFTIAQILAAKLSWAIKIYLEANKNRSFVAAGGVAANKYLNAVIANTAQQHDFEFFTLPIKLCTDNAAMIAYAGLERFNSQKFNDLTFCPRARWNLDEVE